MSESPREPGSTGRTKQANDVPMMTNMFEFYCPASRLQPTPHFKFLGSVKYVPPTQIQINDFRPHLQLDISSCASQPRVAHQWCSYIRSCRRKVGPPLGWYSHGMDGRYTVEFQYRTVLFKTKLSPPRPIPTRAQSFKVLGHVDLF